MINIHPPDTTLPPAVLKISSPLAGDDWRAGSSQSIAWTASQAISNVKIEYSVDGGVSYTTIVASTPNLGSYSWTVPNNPSQGCVMRVSDAQGVLQGTSQAFTISPPRNCTYEVDPSAVSVGVEGGFVRVRLSARPSLGSCPIKPVVDVNWIQLRPGNPGLSIPFDVFHNTGEASRIGTIRVQDKVVTVTQDGTATGNPNRTRFVVPIVLSSAGLGSSFFTSELTLTNSGANNVTLLFDYVSAFGGGSGAATDFLLPRQQRTIPDAISYLRSLGIPIPAEGNRGGTLAVTFVGLDAPSAAAITVRTTTEVGGGRAGLAYAGVSGSNRLTEPVYLCGLRQNASDRSNVAFQNVGDSTDGNLTLRTTVYSGDSTFSIDLPDEILSPGEFRQLTEILKPLGLSNGYAKVQRVAGTAPFYAYGVINDQNNSDGSFVAPISASTALPRRGFTIPVVVENSQFQTEVILTNWSSAPKGLRLNYVAESLDTSDKTTSYSVTLNAREQLIVPSWVQFLRNNGSLGVGPRGITYAGALFVEAVDGDASEVFGSARTSSPGAGGRFGLFYSGVPFGQASTSTAWLFGLQQNEESRTNLAIVNTGETDSSTDLFRVEIYDGTNGTFVTSADFNVKARGWMQIGSIMSSYAPGINQGYVRVTRTSGANPFITYAVINDGATNLERTSDGAFVASSP